jgi:hypothetical protein
VPTTEIMTAKSIDTTDSELIIRLADREVWIRWERCSPMLATATPEQRRRAELSPGGYGIHWPLLNEDLSIRVLVGTIAERNANNTTLPIAVNIPSIVPDLLELCPGIEGRWRDHLAYWQGDERGEYIDISVVVHWLVDSYALARTDFFPALFQKVETILESGHPTQKGVIAVGLLEGLQTVASHRDFRERVFEKWLGPASLAAWKEIEAAWEGKTSLMDVVRDERRHGT